MRPISARVAYYGSDNTNAGKLLARTLVKLTAEKGKIGILTGVLDAENLHERINGMEEVFREYPEMEIVAMEGDDYLIDVGIQKSHRDVPGTPRNEHDRRSSTRRRRRRWVPR